MSTALDVALVVAGALLVLLVLDSAVRTFVLPRGVTVLYSRIVFILIGRVFRLVAARARMSDVPPGV